MPEFKGSVCRVCQVSVQFISVILLYNWLLNFYVLMYVAVPGRNRTLFHCVFRLRYRV